MTEKPPEVRILPMSTEEFDCSVKEIQERFFLKDLPARPNGQYKHYWSGLDTEHGSIVLFQFRGMLVAMATFLDRERFPKPDKNGYFGALYFDPKSIRVFEPIPLKIVRRIWRTVTSFGHMKWYLDPSAYSVFKAQLRCVRQPKVRSRTIR